MSVYHEAPFTLDGYTEIPADSPPAVGVDEYGNREAVSEASTEYAGENLASLTVGSRGRPFEVEVTLEADLEEGFAVDWDFGDGHAETGEDLVQRNTYPGPGVYSISAVVRQPSEPSFALTAAVAFDEEPPA